MSIFESWGEGGRPKSHKLILPRAAVQVSTLAEVVVAPLQHLFVATVALHIFDVAVAVQILAAAAVWARSKSAR